MVSFAWRRGDLQAVYSDCALSCVTSCKISEVRQSWVCVKSPLLIDDIRQILGKSVLPLTGKCGLTLIQIFVQSDILGRYEAPLRPKFDEASVEVVFRVSWRDA